VGRPVVPEVWGGGAVAREWSRVRRRETRAGSARSAPAAVLGGPGEGAGGREGRPFLLRRRWYECGSADWEWIIF
jgi:hypothetical protein